MKRLKIFHGLIFGGLGLLTLGLFQTQAIQGTHYRTLGDKNRIRLIPLEAPRGNVYDRRGNLLATNRASYDVVATPEDMTPEGIAKLSRLLVLSEDEIRKRLTAPRDYPFAPALMLEDVPRALIFKIEEHKPDLPGVGVRVSFIRHYPYRETASHMIGYIGKINREEYERLDRRRFGFNSEIGRTGLEYLYDDRLRGWRGGRQIEVNATGQLVQVLSELPPEPGEDLTITLDLKFQKRIMKLIEEKRASVAVLDLESEGLLALANAPAFDPNVFVVPGKSQERLDFLHDASAPLLDRATRSAYPPGSVFKLVTALAALETQKITPHTRFNCDGSFRLNKKSRPFRCWLKSGHGSLNLYEAIERSCNVYFYNLGKRLSPDIIANYARRLGLGEYFQIDAMRVAPGLVPDRAWKKKRYREKWYQGETLSYAIGQSYLPTSPIEILRLVAMIAKDGQVVMPHILHEPRPEGEKKKIAIHEENLKVIRLAMLHAVESEEGTAQFARVAFDKMAGKTGTAQAPPKRPHSWMAGFFPYQNPKIAFVIFVEHGGAGGLTAAKLVSQILPIWRDLYVAPVA